VGVEARVGPGQEAQESVAAGEVCFSIALHSLLERATSSDPGIHKTLRSFGCLLPSLFKHYFGITKT